MSMDLRHLYWWNTDFTITNPHEQTLTWNTVQRVKERHPGQLSDSSEIKQSFFSVLLFFLYPRIEPKEHHPLPLSRSRMANLSSHKLTFKKCQPPPTREREPLLPYQKTLFNSSPLLSTSWIWASQAPFSLFYSPWMTRTPPKPSPTPCQKTPLS